MKTIQFLKTFSLSALFCILTITLQAQRTQGMNPGMHLKAELALTDSQWEEVAKLREDMRTEMQALREEGRNPANREKAQDIMENYRAEFEAILNDEQKEKWASMQENRKEGMQGRRDRMQGRRGHSSERTDIHALLIEKRTELAESISDTDQAIINELRGNLAEVRDEMKAHMQERKSKRGKSLEQKQNGNSEDVRPRMQRRQGQASGGFPPSMHRDIFSEDDKAKLEILVERYGPQIDALMADMKERRSHKMEIPEEKKAMIAKKQKAHFLLMDPTKMESQQERRAVSVYPNPGSTQQTITFEVQKAGAVNIEIIDKNGTVIQSVFNGNLEKGNNKFSVPVGNLKSDVYFYRITDEEGITSTPFIIQ